MLAAATADGGLCLALCGREDFWDEEVWDEEVDARADGEAAHAGGSAVYAVNSESEEVPVLAALRVKLPGPLADGRPVRLAPAVRHKAAFQC